MKRHTALLMILCCSLTMLASTVSANEDGRLQWRTLPPLPQPSGGQMAGVTNGTLLVIGGSYFNTPPWDGGSKIWLDTVYALAPGASEWKLAGRLPHTLAYGVAVSVDDSVIVIGGADGTRHYAEVFRLRYIDGRLEQTPLPPLPQPNANFGAALLGRTICVAGGQGDPAATAALKTLWSFDLDEKNSRWKSLPTLPGAGRILPATAAQDGAFFIAGGAELSAGTDGKALRHYLRDTWRYQPGRGWSRMADTPVAIAAAPAIPYGQSHIFVFGGDDGSNALRAAELKQNHPGFSRAILAYHTITNTWTNFASMPASLVTTSAVELNGEIIIPGGEDRPAHRSGSVLATRLAISK